MSDYPNRPRWWFFAVAVLIALAAGFFAYNAGVSHGAAMAALQAPAGAAPAPYPYAYPYAYGWHRPWGFGFGPLFFILFFFLLFRGCWGWGGPWRRHWYYEERARMKEGPSADDSRRG
ncbi:MAG TPA: hypothetical protein VL914_00865 [Vicinamibacterales bacterium]|jgi:hypothetical protein|nr:hypothetical protein [Vicinamibacterales bacterium]